MKAIQILRLLKICFSKMQFLPKSNSSNWTTKIRLFVYQADNIDTHFTKLSAICAVAGSPNHILIARNTGKELTVHHERCCYHEPMFRTVLLIIFGLLWSCLFPLFCQNDIVWQKRFINLIFLSLNWYVISLFYFKCLS